MTKAEFYRDKKYSVVEWWLSESHLPGLLWARQRLFYDGMSDVCFDEYGTLYGFADHESSGFFLAEDEFRRLMHLDGEDEREFGINLAEIYPPPWEDHAEQTFEFFGDY